MLAILLGTVGLALALAVEAGRLRLLAVLPGTVGLALLLSLVIGSGRLHLLSALPEIAIRPLPLT